VAAEDQAAIEPAYERRMMAEVDEIVAAIPNDELAIQWDTAVEFALLEGIWPTWFEPVEAGIIERLIRYGQRIPAQVELGYHLCYGDYEHRHFKEPGDSSKLVKISNALAAGLDRPLHWIHLPVPRSRTDEAYFAPLKDLRLGPETELYLGLVHFSDGAEGTQKRIEAAQKVIANFGVATECGLGRRPAETIPDLLRIHAQVAAPIR
jgi:methionine synthase II (cobalamin-independent)